MFPNAHGGEMLHDIQVAKVNKILASVSRLVEAGNRVVFDSPEVGSYIENVKDGKRTFLRQTNGVYFLDVWVPPFIKKNEVDFHRRGQ